MIFRFNKVTISKVIMNKEERVVGRELLCIGALAMDADRVHGCTDRMCRALAKRADVLAALVEAERALARLRPLLARLQMAAGVKGGSIE